jgi:hypothetical protein
MVNPTTIAPKASEHKPEPTAENGFERGYVVLGALCSGSPVLGGTQALDPLLLAPGLHVTIVGLEVFDGAEPMSERTTPGGDACRGLREPAPSAQELHRSFQNGACFERE